MLKKILIANRGEIACRVIRTAQRLGVKTVAVYSEADINALHVQLADEAIAIGPAPVAQSYLNAERILQAAQQSGAEAIHPGYGFLSENPDFVEQVNTADLRFIGPSASAIRSMGLKDAAKRLMEEAGVPVVPGYHGDNQDAAFLAEQADKIGYPVLIKARAGGGGKGMRRVDAAVEFQSALESAQREAEASFGDAACLIEKYVSAPRHIEIQVFGDDHGNVVHLFERDCSLQRRHQKVIEEAPAPDMPEEVREAMGSAAVRAAQTIDYSGAGTVEFIVDGSDGLRADRFWFMEMNTRLQVEHPVTEMITGLDLVEWQLRVASGEALPLQQSQLAINGWAMEARIYAEDADRDFLPASGTLDYLQFSSSARVDTGVRQGDTITPYYDPMIAKLIVHAATRAAAINQMASALRATHIAGSTTNVEFLHALCRNDNFVAAQLHTGLIERDLASLTRQLTTPPNLVIALAALGATGLLQDKARHTGFNLWQPLQWDVHLRYSHQHVLKVAVLSKARFTVQFEQAAIEIEVQDSSAGIFRIDGQQQTALVVVQGQRVSVFHNGSWHFEIPDPLLAGADDDVSSDAIAAPMSGQIKLVLATVEQSVSEGQALIVMEAMKMEHTLLAPRDGAIEWLDAEPGVQVDEGQMLCRLKPLDD